MEKYKILIVDDDPMSNAMLRKLFESEYEIRFAENGEEAIEIINKDEDNPAGLILLDILMPGINGFEVCRRLKNDDATANIPVIFITSLNNDEDTIEGLKLGAADYITKPFNPAIVKLRVQTQLKLKKDRDQIEELTKHLEQLLEHQTAMLELEQDIVRNMAEGVSVIEPGTGTIIYVNPTFERIFGYNSNELTGKCIFTLNALSRKSDQIPSELNYSKPDEINRILLEKGIWTGDMLNIKKDGTIFWLYSKITGYNHPIHGKVWLGVHEDIADRKAAEESLIASEQQLKLITETITEVFWMADSKIGKMFYISPAYERIWGCTCRSLYENPRSFIDAVHPEDKERVITELKESRINKRSFDHEYRIIRPDKSIRWIRDRGFPVFEKTGEAERHVGIAQDITDKKAADLELDKYRHYLEQLVEQRTAELEEKQAQLLHAAMHDILKGFPKFYFYPVICFKIRDRNTFII